MMKKPISIVAFVRSVDVVGLSAINALRAIQPLTYLNNDRGFNIGIVDQEKLKGIVRAGTTKSLLGHDLYVVSRLFAGNRGRDEFLEAVHGHGGLVIFDTDDDLSDDHRDLGRGEDFKGIIGDVDAVTVTTAHLAKHLEKYTGYRPWVLPNHIDVRWFAGTSMEAPRTVEGLTIGFIGTASHYDDWKYPVEALRRIALEHDEVTIVAAGYTPDYLADLPRIIELEPVPYVAYPAMIRQFDIVCASLDSDDEFNKSKSSVKALEAMSAARVLDSGKVGGAIAVCSDMPVYRRTVNNKHNGLLVENSGKAWYSVLKILVEDKHLRNKLAVQGYRWVKKHRDVAVGYRLWGRAYEAILSRGRR